MSDHIPPKTETNQIVGGETITFRRSFFFTALVPVAFVVGLAVGYLFWGRPAEPTPDVQNAAAQVSPTVEQAAAEGEEQAGSFKRYPVPVDDDPVIGPENAPITIIEFSDFQCPFCQRWHAETWTKIVENYGDKVRLVYRDFPLSSIHPEAVPAAEAANCANEQGGFWEYHARLFSNQAPLGTETYKKYAADAGLDQKRFEACLNERKYKDEVQADLDYAVELGVRSTPTFFLNGIPIVGAQPYEVFQQVIDKELAGELPK